MNNNIKFWHDKVKSGKDTVYCIGVLRECVKETGKTLKEVGIDEEEIIELERQGYVVLAEEFLKASRRTQRSNNIAKNEKQLRKCMENILRITLDMGLKEIGATKMEIDDFKENPLTI